MAKGRNKRAKQREAAEPMDGPTPEQEVHGNFARQLQPDMRTSPNKRVVEIDRLHKLGTITDRQHRGLARYRDMVNADERSPIKDSIAKAIEGRTEGGGGFPLNTYASIERGYLERALGALRGIAYAVCFEDKSPSQWAMEQSGSVERRRGKIVWFEPRKKALDIARIDIQMAGERLAAAIDA